MLLSQEIIDAWCTNGEKESDREWAHRDHKEAKEIEKAVETIGNAINHQSYRFVARAIFGELQRTHRYLQGELGRALMAVLAMYADLGEYEYDARNEWLINAAREIGEKTPYLIK